MILDTLEKLKANIKPLNKIMGLDVSKKYLGIAISDNSLTLAFPHKIINRTKLNNDLAILQEIIIKENIYALVLGLPLDLDGNSGVRVQSIKSFASIVHKNFPNTAIFFEDERYSTIFAKDSSSNKKIKQVDDKAAAWFLQNFLDKLKNVVI